MATVCLVPLSCNSTRRWVGGFTSLSCAARIDEPRFICDQFLSSLYLRRTHLPLSGTKNYLTRPERGLLIPQTLLKRLMWGLSWQEVDELFNASGHHTEALVEAVDLFDTLTELTGFPSPGSCPRQSEHVPLCTEGTSLVPLIRHLTVPGTGGPRQVRSVMSVLEYRGLV